MDMIFPGEFVMVSVTALPGVGQVRRVAIHKFAALPGIFMEEPEAVTDMECCVGHRVEFSELIYGGSP